MLIDMIASVPAASNSELQLLIADVLRMCCSSEHMFIYSHDLLDTLELTMQRSVTSSSDAKRPVKALLNIRRLRQDLERAAIWDRRDSDGNDLMTLLS